MGSRGEYHLRLKSQKVSKVFFTLLSFQSLDSGQGLSKPKGEWFEK